MSALAPAPAEPAPSRARLRPAPLEAAVLAAAAVVLVAQLMVPPLVGLADNGDFARVSRRFAIDAPPMPAAERYFVYFISRYEVGPAHFWSSGYVTSLVPLVVLARGLNALLGKAGWFDLRFLAALHVALLLAGMWLLMVAARRFRLAGRVVFAALLAVIFTDVGYAAYLNSFYSEPVSLTFLLLTTALAALAIGGRATLPVLVLAGACALALVTAKPQNFVAGLPLAALLARLAVLGDGAWKAVCVALAVVILSAAAFMVRYGNTAAIREQALQIAVFHDMLPHSPAPSSDLRELGLAPELARYSGLHPWAPGAPSREDPQFRAAFVDRMTMGGLLAFYARHPRRLWRALDRVSAQAFLARPPLGNFEKSAGRPAFSRSQRFDAWSRIRQRAAPRSLAALLGLSAAAAMAAAAAWTRAGQRGRMTIELGAAVALIALGQLLVVTVGAGRIDAIKHTFLFKAAADLCLAGGMAWLGSGAAAVFNQESLA